MDPGDSQAPVEDPQGRNWKERLAAKGEAFGRGEEPYVLIVGGGQAGLALAARLEMLGVPYLVVDRHPRVGDQWRSRYRSLTLHDPVWYDHMPYLPFPDFWPVFTPKDKMGDWLAAYAHAMELAVWTGTDRQTLVGRWCAAGGKVMSPALAAQGGHAQARMLCSIVCVRKARACAHVCACAVWTSAACAHPGLPIPS